MEAKTPGRMPKEEMTLSSEIDPQNRNEISFRLKQVQAKDVTHSGGRGEPFHDWFPYLEGYSSQFVKQILEAKFNNPKSLLEPFCGVGTTPIALAQLGISCGYTEVNPFLVELVTLKAACLKMSPAQRDEAIKGLRNLKMRVSVGERERTHEALRVSYLAVFGTAQYFRSDAFDEVLSLKSIESSIVSDTLLNSFFRMAVACSLLEASLLRRAGDVRFKTEKELQKPIRSISDLVIDKLSLFENDLNSVAQLKAPEIKLLGSNAKNLVLGNAAKYDGVITSPPYLNGTNYIRNMKLELWYLGYLSKKSDLGEFRKAVVTSAINDVSKTSGLLIVDEAKEIVDAVSNSCYDARIPRMIAGYFEHMKLVAEGIFAQVQDGAPVCIDIGDSVYGGIHVPTHEILSAVFGNVGLTLEDEVILRKRHSNRGAALSQRLLIFRK
ncbi:hypothetical protein [Marivivens donghaensis]|uniref:hypothetical protein n=1 Tax=Marivivens donghaensis TaxID=1699413 RepID=UPI00201EEB9C|nr:hypothetical protein [Marivivens donghaensis]MCL7409448.1 hypothetical protein [Marivivens donghaensis]MDN3702927.1 hypothetical protein [Marivivens donghaensis]